MVGIVDAYSLFFIGLLDHDNASYPVRIVCYSNEPCNEELDDLFIDCFLSFIGVASLFLPNRLIPRVDAQLMSDYL